MLDEDKLPEMRVPTGKRSFMRLSYKPTYDIFQCRFAQDGETDVVSVDVAGQMWVRMNAHTGDVLGYEIEDFKAVFLKRHPDLALMWSEIEDAVLEATLEQPSAERRN